MRGKDITKQRQFLIDCLVLKTLTKDNLQVLALADYSAAKSFFGETQLEKIKNRFSKPDHIIPKIWNICILGERDFETDAWKKKAISKSLSSLRNKHCQKHNEPHDLSDLDLRGMDFTDADLFSADLSGANFDNCNLQGANLQDSNMNSTNLLNANIDEALLSNR